MSSANILIDWKKKTPNSRDETIKWQIANSKYEIHTPELNDLDIAVFLPHCLDVRNKVISAVAAENHKAASLFRVFPRTISPVLRSIWDNIVEGAPNDATEQDFHGCLMDFIAVHVTAEDRHDLLSQLRSASKPRDLHVQTFYYRLREINDYVIWMPGNELSLTEEQLKQAFYDAMPATWKERFLTAGKSVHSDTFAQIVRYFRQQEILAAQKQLSNDATNRNRNQSHDGKGPKGKGDKRPFNRNNHKRDNSSRNNDGNKKPDAKKKKTDSEVDCPFHPGHHKWGSCYENARNANSPFNKNKNGDQKGKKSGQFHVATDGEVESTEKSNEELPLNMDGTSYRNDDYSSNLSAVTSHIFAIDSWSCEMQNDAEQGALAFGSYVTDLFVRGSDDDENKNSSELYSENNTYRAAMDSLKPIGLLKADTIQNSAYPKPLKVLFDTGSETTFINSRCLSKGVVPSLERSITIHTLTGDKPTNRSVILKGVSLPEFSPTKKIDKSICAFVFDHDSPYDMIVGNDVLMPIGFDFLLSIKAMKWMDTLVPWKAISYFRDPLIDGLVNEAHCFFIENKMENSIDEFFPRVSLHATTTKIKESKYELTPTKEIVDAQGHLDKSQKAMLFDVLDQFQPLFNGNLIAQGRLPEFNGPKVNLELLPDAIPIRGRPYPVASKHREVFKHELDRLEQIGVLSRTGPQQWLSPTFIVPKKDGRVRWVSDFRALNKCIRRKVYNLPRIQDILKKRNGYQFFTKIDILKKISTFAYHLLNLKPKT